MSYLLPDTGTSHQVYKNMEQERLWILLGRKLANVATEEELQELELLLLAYGEDAGVIEIMERMWNSRQTPVDDDNDAIRNRVNEGMEKSGKHRHLWVFCGILACLAALAGFQVFRNPHGVEKAETMNVVFTRKKSHSNLQFPDGTVVVLNENSRLSYNADFGQTKREIILEGEAYFNVAKNAGTPLIIHAKNVDIRVLGTSFNIKAYPKDKSVETSLIRGKVELSLHKFPERPVVLRPNEKIDIRVAIADTSLEAAGIADSRQGSREEEPDTGAGSEPWRGNQPASKGTSQAQTNQVPDKNNNNLSDTITYHLQPLQAERSSNLIPEIAWMYRKLVFNQEPFESVAEKMERWYDVHIYFEDDDLKKELFTGSFGKETLGQALKAMQFSYYFDFIIKQKEVFIKRK
ncbi:FecR family protein [Flavitalea flava]